MLQSYNDLIKLWENRWSEMLAYAEEGCFEHDTYKEQRFVALARQWNKAIIELKEVIQYQDDLDKKRKWLEELDDDIMGMFGQPPMR